MKNCCFPFFKPGGSQPAGGRQVVTDPPAVDSMHPGLDHLHPIMSEAGIPNMPDQNPAPSAPPSRDTSTASPPCSFFELKITSEMGATAPPSHNTSKASPPCSFFELKTKAMAPTAPPSHNTSTASPPCSFFGFNNDVRPIQDERTLSHPVKVKTPARIQQGPVVKPSV